MPSHSEVLHTASLLELYLPSAMFILESFCILGLTILSFISNKQLDKASKDIMLTNNRIDELESVLEKKQ